MILNLEVAVKCNTCGYESSKYPYKDQAKLQESVKNDGGYVFYHKGDKCPICKTHNDMRMIWFETR